MLTTRLGEDQRFVTRSLRAVVAILIVLAVAGIYNAVSVSSRMAWAELALLAIAIAFIEFALRRQADSRSLITAQRDFNTKLSASEAKFSGILAIAADAIIVVDESQLVMHFNYGAEQVFGFSAAEVIGQPLSLLLPTRFHEVHHAHVKAFAMSSENARRMGHRRTVVGRRKDGSEFPAEAAISKLQAADSSRIFSVVLRDITEQKFAEDAERFVAHSLAQMTSSLDEVTVSQRIVEDVVPMLADACVLELGEGQETRRVCHASDERTRSALITLAEEFAETDGSDVWRDLHARSRLIVPLIIGNKILGRLWLFDLGTRSDRFGAQIRSVIEEFVRNAAFALENSQLYATARRATEVRDEVLGLVSHDLKNPLGAIAMCVRILREAPTTDRAAHDRMISAISESVVWMQGLIRDLLDVTSIEAGRLAIDRQPVVASKLASSALGMVMSELALKAIKLDVQVSDDLPIIDVDGARIVQVLSNLIGNAIKFTPAAGRITVTIKQTADGTLFSVADTGIGIAHAMQAQIFNRFWQQQPAHQGGHGLGLAIAHGIVSAHGGRLRVESEVGKGSDFSFVIPYPHSELPVLMSSG